MISEDCVSKYDFKKRFVRRKMIRKTTFNIFFLQISENCFFHLLTKCRMIEKFFFGENGFVGI